MPKSIGAIHPSLFASQGKKLRLVFLSSRRQVELARALERVCGVTVFRVRGVHDVLLVHADSTIRSLNIQLEGVRQYFSPDNTFYFETERFIKFGGTEIRTLDTYPDPATLSEQQIFDLILLTKDWNHPVAIADREGFVANHFLLPQPLNTPNLRERCLRRSIVLISVEDQTRRGRTRFEDKVLKEYLKDDTVKSILCGRTDGEEKSFHYALDILANPYDLDQWLDHFQQSAFEVGAGAATRTIDLESVIKDELTNSLLYESLDGAQCDLIEAYLSSRAIADFNEAYSHMIERRKALAKLHKTFATLKFPGRLQTVVAEIDRAIRSENKDDYRKAVEDLLGYVAAEILHRHPDIEPQVPPNATPGAVLGKYKKLHGDQIPGRLQSLFQLNELKNLYVHGAQNDDLGRRFEALTTAEIYDILLAGLAWFREVS